MCAERPQSLISSFQTCPTSLITPTSPAATCSVQKRGTCYTNTTKSNLRLLFLKYLCFSTKQVQVPAGFTDTSKFLCLSSGIIQETPEDPQCYGKFQRLLRPERSAVTVNRRTKQHFVCKLPRFKPDN